MALLTLLLLASPTLAADRRTPIVEAVERATPAVVTVQVEIETQNPFWGASLGASEGSGVVIRSDGVVLTNAHVVEGARSVTVSTSDGGRWPATVMALERNLDLAVLQVENAPALPTVALGDSDDLLLGETVIAIGNPLGLGLTVSTGVVGSVRRDVEIQPGLHQSFIQTDAAINPGNSGGALVDINGQLIGINTAIRADAEGIGFAIPVNRAIKIAADLVDYGAVRAPWLGIDVGDLDTRTLRGTPIASGAVVVQRVVDGGPAEAAGLRTGDLIHEVEGKTVSSRADLNARLAERTPGDRVVVAFYREGRRSTVTLKSSEVPADIGEDSLTEDLGIEVVGAKQGVVVSRATASGTWTRAKLRTGDVIVAIDGQPVRTATELADALRRARAQHRGAALFTVRRGPYQGHVTLAL